MPLISCKKLTLGYDGRTVISELSFEVGKGDYLCIVGENGSGKTTLMKTILRLKNPESGEIIMGDGLSQGEIGYLPQQTAIQKDFPATVSEVVASGCLNRMGLRPFFNQEEKKLIALNMTKLDILPLAKRCYRELSGGQQQRVLLARALCATKKILLLDEPTASLDPKASAELYAITEKLNKDGITIIIISHDICACLQYATHILHIGGENALFYGSKEDYLTSEAGRIYGGEN